MSWNSEPPAIALRSCTSSRDATFQPSFTSPMTSAAGTTTLSKNSWQNPVAPVTRRSGITSSPGARSGTTNMVSPRCLGTSQSVRARQKP